MQSAVKKAVSYQLSAKKYEEKSRVQRAWCIARSRRPRKKELDEKRLWKKRDRLHFIYLTGLIP